MISFWLHQKRRVFKLLNTLKFFKERWTTPMMSVKWSLGLEFTSFTCRWSFHVSGVMMFSFERQMIRSVFLLSKRQPLAGFVLGVFEYKPEGPIIQNWHYIIRIRISYYHEEYNNHSAGLTSKHFFMQNKILCKEIKPDCLYIRAARYEKYQNIASIKSFYY